MRRPVFRRWQGEETPRTRARRSSGAGGAPTSSSSWIPWALSAILVVMAVIAVFMVAGPSRYQADAALVIVLDPSVGAIDDAVDGLEAADTSNAVGTLTRMLSSPDLHRRAMKAAGIDPGETGNYRVTVTSPTDSLMVTVEVDGPGPDVARVAGEIVGIQAGITAGAFPGLALEARTGPVSGGDVDGNPFVSMALGLVAVLVMVGGAITAGSSGRTSIAALRDILKRWMDGRVVLSRTRYGPLPDIRIAVLTLVAIATVLVLGPGNAIWLGVGALAGVSLLFALRFPRLLVIGLVALVLFNLSDIGTDFFGLPGISVPYTLFVIVVLALRAWVLGEESRTWLGLAIAIAALVAVMSFSGLFAVDQGVAFERTVDLVKNGLLVLLIVVLIRDLVDLRRVVWTLILGTSFLSLLGIARTVLGSTPGLLEGFSQVVREVVDEEVVGIRIAGPLGDANFFGQFLVLVFPLALDRAFRARLWVPRGTAVVATLVIATAVALTYSRGALIGLVVATGVALVFIRPGLRTVLVTILVSGVVLVLLPSQYVDRIGSLAQVFQIGSGAGVEDASLQGRLGEMVVGLQMFHDHPFTGVGPGNYPGRYVEYSSGLGIDYRLELRQPHSLPIEVAAELGILGLAWWTIAAYLLGKQLLRARRVAGMGDQDELRQYLEAVCASFAGFAATSLFLHLAFSRSLWMMVGIAIGAIGLTRDRSDRAMSVLERQTT